MKKKVETGLDILKALPKGSEEVISTMSPEELDTFVALVKGKSKQLKETKKHKEIVEAQQEQIEEILTDLKRKIFAYQWANFFMVVWGFLTVLLTRLLPFSLLEELQKALPMPFLNDLILFFAGSCLFNLSTNLTLSSLFYLSERPPLQKQKDLILAKMSELYAPTHPNDAHGTPIKMQKAVNDLKEHFGLTISTNALGRKINKDPQWHRKYVVGQGPKLFVKFKKAKP